MTRVERKYRSKSGSNVADRPLAVIRGAEIVARKRSFACPRGAAGQLRSLGVDKLMDYLQIAASVCGRRVTTEPTMHDNCANEMPQNFWLIIVMRLSI
jgi:hypothetical protein